MTAPEYHASDSTQSSPLAKGPGQAVESEFTHASLHSIASSADRDTNIDSCDSCDSFDPSVNPSIDPHLTALGIYVTVHGHFYQPPRENPYLNTIERQPSAASFHDWNERIHYECYRPNAFARVLNDREEVIGIVNNFEYLSFNIGPTLMSWLERHDVEVYRRIIDADRKSCERLHGHGNAIAQVYNHIIMPLANERDKYTQIRWGKADFRSRFGRDPEGMWLAETAVDYATLEALVNEGIKFIILAPSQAQRCRTIPTHDNPNPEWREVGGSQIDPIRPYRCYLRSQDHSSDPHSFPYIDIFFYDGPISRDMGFDGVLSSSGHFAGRIGQAVRGDHRSSQLIAVATDGETFGHHKGGTEKALAYAFTAEFPRRGWTVTNFAHYLSLSPPTWEVELKPVTAWSCSHGVDRWQDDCGCGGGGHWNQKWRRPLRDSLDWLRDQLVKVYEETGRKFFNDPWLARDEYVKVILDRSSVNVNRFFSRHQVRKLTGAEKVDALRLLEMQRHTQLMYTSCGWFFDELSRPEGTQILRYAARAIELAGDVAGVQLEKGFIRRLAAAPSNVEFFQNGAEVYRQLVIPAQVSLDQVAAHYAITSLFTSYPRDERVYCYTVHQLDYQLQRLGNLTLAVGQIQLTSEITWESGHLIFAVLHLGGWDFHCCIRPFSGRRNYSQMKDSLFDALRQASAAQTILAMNRNFGDQSYSLQSLFAEERHRIMRLLSHETLTRLDQLYTQVYRDNYGVLVAFHRDTLDVPQELQVAAEIAISHRAITSLQALEREASEFPFSNPQVCLSHLIELEAIAAEADHLHCQLKLPEIKQILERMVYRSFRSLLTSLNPMTVEADIHWINRLLTLADKLHLHLSLDRTQELFFQILHTQILPQLVEHYQEGELSSTSGISLAIDSAPSVSTSAVPNGHRAHTEPTVTLERWTPGQLRQLLLLGQKLTIDVQYWLALLG
jgi:alpha-amylase/alpha-mannosidase (GH57 family)